MRTRVMKIIAVCEATMNTHKTILLYDPIARTQSDHRFPYPNNHHKRDLGLYLKFGFNSTGGSNQYP